MKDCVYFVLAAIMAVFIFALFTIGAILLFGDNDHPYLHGYDNGEAYESYMKSMEDYGENNGLYPDIYGYGWGSGK